MYNLVFNMNAFYSEDLFWYFVFPSKTRFFDHHCVLGLGCNYNVRSPQ